MSQLTGRKRACELKLAENLHFSVSISTERDLELPHGHVKTFVMTTNPILF